MLHRVGMPLDIMAQRLERVARGFGARQHDHTVTRSMGQKYRRVVVRCGPLGCGGGGQRQVTRQTHDARQPLGVAQPDHQCHRTALRKARNHDAAGRYAALFLTGNQRFDGRLRLAQSGFVFALDQISAQNVVPGRHLKTTVDGDRHDGRAGKKKAHIAHTGQIELLGNRQKVSAVGTEAMHDKDGGNRVFTGLGFDNLEGHGWAG